MTHSMDSVNRAISLVAELSIDRASQSLSKTLRTGARIELRKVMMVDITEATAEMNKNNFDAVAAFIDLVGDAPLKFLFMVETKSALLLTDMMLRKPVGTTLATDSFANSSVQEIGNILASSICNIFTAEFLIDLRPAPPALTEDFSGSLFSELIAQTAADQDQVLLIESVFEVVKYKLNCFMFILPLPGSDAIFKKAVGQ